ncbi:hypothetical protein F511_21191 [Dorcoceras hygrometricum]|uniref:Uncharacterized protein n=1 Tax=Dorcoceras hygrometricum TaxID=472368 RepID=A0A2Z7B9A6_9LAMI|nr:hypothetical protein F511_21191 [Dorcoceras hygrometricum]
MITSRLLIYFSLQQLIASTTDHCRFLLNVLYLAADVIISGHNFFQSAMMTSSLLITTSSNRNADVIIADTSSS